MLGAVLLPQKALAQGCSFAFSPADLFLAAEGGPFQVDLLLTTTGGGTCPETISFDIEPEWIRLVEGGFGEFDFSTGTFKFFYVFGIDPNPLPNRREGQVHVTSGSAPGGAQLATLTFTQAGSGPLLTLGSDTLRFQFAQGSPPQTQRVLVTNRGEGAIPIDVGVTTESGGPWLSVVPANAEVSPDLPVILQITAEPLALPGGVYLGNIDVSSDQKRTMSIDVAMALTNRVGVLSAFDHGLLETVFSLF